MSSVLCNYLTLSDTSEKWRSCLQLMREMRILIAKTNRFELEDPSEILVDFNKLSTFSRDTFGANVALARDKNTQKFIIAKQYYHTGSWILPQPLLRQLHCSFQFLEAQVAEPNAAVRTSDHTWRVKGCVQKIIDIHIEEHMTHIMFKYYPIMLSSVFQSKVHHDLNFVLETVNDLVFAVYTMHSAGVAHRDIKFENLCFNAHSRVVLIDFDSGAKCLGDENMRITRPVCSLYTRPPEHFYFKSEEKKESYDAIAGDWWSVGCVIAQIFLEGANLFPVKKDLHEQEYVKEMCILAKEFETCFEKKLTKSTIPFVKDLIRAQMPHEMKQLLVGLLSLNPETRKLAAKLYITHAQTH